MSLLRDTNSHDRDKCITFREDDHVYFINEGLLEFKECTEVNDSYTSVTTYIHTLFPVFDPDKVIKKMMSSPNWHSNRYYGMKPKEIKTMWNESAQKASNNGTKMHADIESYLNQQRVTNDSREYEYFLKFIKKISSSLNIFRTEWMIWDSDFKICGSIDAVFKTPDGEYHIYDWKRSKEIKKFNRFQRGTHHLTSDMDDCNYNHYTLQLNIYKYILEKNYGIKIKSISIAVFHPKNLNYRVYKVRDEQELVHNLMKDRIAQTISKNI